MLVGWVGRSEPPIASLHTRPKPGGQVLGFSLVWSDSTDYALGVRLGMLIEPASPLDRFVPGRCRRCPPFWPLRHS
jgi:hypothetical protein